MMTVISAPGDLVVAISDGIGVRFAGIELTTGLQGRTASWTYLPEPPEHAGKLNLEFILDGEPTGKTCQVQID